MFRTSKNNFNKLFGNWIKIFKLNKTKKEKAEHREKHLEAVRAEKDKENQNQEKAQGSYVTDSKSSKEKQQR